MSENTYSPVYIRHELLRHYSVRKSSFKLWINKEFDYRSLVDAGFVYSGFGDEVFCFSCGIRISGWKSRSHAFLMHRSESPGCYFLQGFDLSVNDSKVKGKLSAIGFPLITANTILQFDQKIAEENVKHYSLKWPPQIDTKSTLNGIFELPTIDAKFKNPIIIPKSQFPKKLYRSINFSNSCKSKKIVWKHLKLKIGH